MKTKNGLIIIPAFNEESSIADVVDDIQTNNIDLPVLVINDGSKDKTLEVLQKLKIKYISHPINLGYGSSLKTGYAYALENGYDFVVQFDADGQHRANEIKNLLTVYSNESLDIVLGSRYSKKSGFKISLSKKIVITFFSLWIKIMSGKRIYDLTSGFQLINKKAFSFFSNLDEFPAEHPDANIILLSLKKGFKIKEIPVIMGKRQRGVGMFSGWRKLLYLFEMALNVFIIRIRRY